MIGELSSALPFEGGYYAWVRRAMGSFWGFQEAWLSLVASIFDMAIYPTLFVAYLTRMFPWFQENHRGVAVALGVVIVCAVLNIMGVKVVSTTSLWLFFALSAPFAAIFVLAPFKIHALASAVTKPTTSNVDILGGLLICMWNYMGWDNASTIATEVERPQRTYPRAMLWRGGHCLRHLRSSLCRHVDHRPSGHCWETGAWADIAQLMGGPVLRIALVAGGMMSGFGMFNALVMSYSRLPLAMAQDGMLPKVFGKLHPKSRAPWVAILALAVGWGFASESRLRTAGHARHHDLWRQPGARIRRSDLPAHSRTEIEAPVPRARRHVWSDCGWHSSSLAAGICHPPQRTRSCARHELALVRPDPDRRRRGRLS